MIKNFLLAIALVFGGVSFAPQAKADFSYSACYAYTVCNGPYGPYVVSCSVLADSSSGTACSWYVYPGVGVRCEGITGQGLWETIYANCY